MEKQQRLKAPLIIINFKNYPEIFGKNAVKLARIAEKVANETKVNVAVSPPQASIAVVSQSVEIPVLCQHLDEAPAGAATGFFIPEMAKSFGASGSLLNHSEHRLSQKSVTQLITRLRKLQMTSVVCAQTPREVGLIAKFDPDYVAIEPPELIGSGKAVSKQKPSVITRSVTAKSRYDNSTRLICGAGITNKSDVSIASRLGAEGVLVASSIVKAGSWRDRIHELAMGFREA